MHMVRRSSHVAGFSWMGWRTLACIGLLGDYTPLLWLHDDQNGNFQYNDWLSVHSDTGNAAQVKIRIANLGSISIGVAPNSHAIVHSREGSGSSSRPTGYLIHVYRYIL